METQEFYDGLRKEDRCRAERIVSELKSRGLEVYAAGSSLRGITPSPTKYQNIDLVVASGEGMTRGDTIPGVEAVVKMFGGQKIMKRVSEEPLKYFPKTQCAEDFKPIKLGDTIIKILGVLGMKLPEDPSESQYDTYMDEEASSMVALNRGFDKPLHPPVTETYANSPVIKYTIGTIGETPIDLTLSYKPFSVMWNALRVKL